MEPHQVEIQSAIDRKRAEEREEDRRRGFARDEGQRGVMAAIWRLARTAGANLSHIILGIERVEHLKQTYPDRWQSREQIAAAREREAFAAELRGEVPKAEHQATQRDDGKTVEPTPATSPALAMPARRPAPIIEPEPPRPAERFQEITKTIEPVSSPQIVHHAAARDLGRVQGLIDALGVAPAPQHETLLERIEREAKERGEDLDKKQQRDQDRDRERERSWERDLDLF